MLQLNPIDNFMANTPTGQTSLENVSLNAVVYGPVIHTYGALLRYRYRLNVALPIHVE